MQIILLHGDDEIKSYERLQKFVSTAKARSWEVVYIGESPLSLQEDLSAVPLFGRERFFVLKDIKKLGKSEIEWLKRKNININANLVIYHQGVVPVTLIKSLPKTVKVEEFKLPKVVFEFLESIRPKNAKRAIELMHKLSEKDPPEFILSFVARHLRDLYWVKVEASVIPYPDWRVGKLKAQAESFSINLLREFIDKLAEIDVEVKTSNSEIIPSLDLLLATKLE